MKATCFCLSYTSSSSSVKVVFISGSQMQQVFATAPLISACCLFRMLKAFALKRRRFETPVLDHNNLIYLLRGSTSALTPLIHHHVWKRRCAPVGWWIFIYPYKFCHARMLVLWMINAFVIWWLALVSTIGSFKWKAGFHLWWTYEDTWQGWRGDPAIKQSTN